MRRPSYLISLACILLIKVTSSLAVDGLHQGMYDSYIDVIGEKMGGDTSVVYFTDPTKFEHRLCIIS